MLYSQAVNIFSSTARLLYKHNAVVLVSSSMKNLSHSQFCESKTCFVSLRSLHTSSSYLFYEKDMKGGYESKTPNVSPVQMVREGLTELRKEVGVWKEEVKERLLFDPIGVYRPGEIDIVWKFNSPDCLSSWVATSDKDHNEGFSTCDLKITPGKKCLFSGVLDTKVPKDGRIKKAGYCNMRSQRRMKSFKRDAYYEWDHYTHIVLRVRGDGRSYLLNLSTVGYFDILWNDVYHYVLYTRGGPYWQISKIPFSKFFLGSKGRVQDKQGPIPLSRVTNFGVSVGDAINGPFHLEIDYIGLEFDPSHQEEFAYEMYETENFIAGS